MTFYDLCMLQMWKEMQLITGRDEGRDGHMARLEHIMGLVLKRAEGSEGKHQYQQLNAL